MTTVSKTVSTLPWKQRAAQLRPSNSPLSIHVNGWCKRIGGKLVTVAGKVSHEEAIKRYHIKMAAHYAKADAPDSVTVPVPTPAVPAVAAAPVPQPVAVAASVTASQIKDKYVEAKRKKNLDGKYSDRSLQTLEGVLNRFAAAYGARRVDTLTCDDFAAYREDLAGHFKSPFTVEKHILNVRAIFNWAVKRQNRLIPNLPDWFDSFNVPDASEKTKYAASQKRKNGEKIFEPAEMKKLLEACDTVERAMVLLGLNCAYGNSDIARLTIASINFSKNVIDNPRVKTGADRRATLWPETVNALKAAVAARPTPKDPGDSGLVFLTATGLKLVATRRDEAQKISRSDSTTVWFNRVQQKAGIYRKNRGWYALRHTLATTAAEIEESEATRRIMGHKMPGVMGGYVQRIKDRKLKVVTDYVREQFLDAIAEPTPPPTFGEVERPPLDLS